jgi:iron complex outermembrane receptor protein
MPVFVPRAHAQGAMEIEEVVVTSRKREESLLDIPLTVTAFSSDDIETLALDELPDIVDFSPGFYYSENSVGRGGRFNRRLVFRGMNPRTDRQTRQGATVFIDGAPILGSEIGSTENYERIEVIKGPQSAYFGRSTFSGAINAVTKTPGDEWSGQVNGEVGRFGTTDFGAQIEGPLIDDKLAFRLNGSQYNTDGEYANSADPTQRLGRESTTDVGLSLYITPNDQFTAKLRLHYWTDQDGPTIGTSIRREDHPELFTCMPGGGGAGGGLWACGEIPFLGVDEAGMDTALTPQLIGLFYNQAIRSAFIFDKVPYGSGLERHAQEISLNLDYELANGMTLSSITAAHQNEYSSFEDFDRRPTAGLDFGAFVGGADTYNLNLTGLKDFFQEVRLTSAQDERLRWMIGVSYTEIENRLQSFSKFGPVNPRPTQSVSTFDPETTAIFGAVGWDINDQFTLSVEARSQQDKVVEGTLGNTPLSETFDSFNPRVILDYKPNDDTTFYATYAEGTNPGQFNAGLLGRTQAELDQIAAAGGGGIRVDEEELTNFEFGVKSQFWDGRGQISAAVYFSDWDNIVAPEIIAITNAQGQGELVQVNSTGGQADLSGLELEGTLLLTEKLTLDATLALNKSEINDFESPDANVVFGDRTIDGLGNSFSRYPETSGTLSLTYADALTANYDWFARGDAIYRGNTWATNANITETPAYTIFNLRVGVETESWRIEAFGTNIFNEQGVSQLQYFTDLSRFGSGERMLMAGLIPYASFGARATFRW